MSHYKKSDFFGVSKKADRNDCKVFFLYDNCVTENIENLKS